MQPLLAALKPLAMQYLVDVARENIRYAISLLPAAAKAIGVVAAAEEAWAVAGRQRGRFVEEEQFGPAPARHHLAAPAAEFADAGDPCRSRPALLQQGLGGGIVDDAAIAGEDAAMLGGDDVAGGCDAVLQGHLLEPTPHHHRHCEERSDEAIQSFFARKDWIASLRSQ